jgi:NADH-ubiquinone oxidoreductase chain 2
VQLFLNTNRSLETSINSENQQVVSSSLNSNTGNSQERDTSTAINNNFITIIYLSNIHSYLISVLTLSFLLFILNPSLILNSTQLLSLSLFYW